ncbi:MAG: nitroreductase family protein [Candidatus Pacearchaeota archaeon]
MDIGEVIKNRRSVRKFTDKVPDWRDIIEAIDSMRYSPTAGNNFPLKFILVNDKKKIEEVAKDSEQEFISKSRYMVVVYSAPLKTMDSFGAKKECYSRQQAGAAIQNFLLKIHDLGLATCWVGHFKDEEKIKYLFKIPKGSDLEAVFPIGYTNENKKPRKIRLDEVLRFNDAQIKEMKKERDLDI